MNSLPLCLASQEPRFHYPDVTSYVDYPISESELFLDDWFDPASSRDAPLPARSWDAHSSLSRRLLGHTISSDSFLIESARVASASVTVIGLQFPFLAFCKQVISRRNLLIEIASHLNFSIDDISHGYTIPDSVSTSQASAFQGFARYYASVLSLLDIYNTIDNHCPVQQAMMSDWRKHVSEFPQSRIRSMFGITKDEAFQDEATIVLLKVQELSRRGRMIQRLKNALTEAHNNGFYIVFDTLTLAPHSVSDFL